MLYHWIPEGGVKGDFLYPLNHLKYQFPEVYEREAAKYRGREGVRRTRIPTLACGWGDVIFLSPIHPLLMLRERIRLGHISRDHRKVRYLAIDPVLLDPARTSVWMYTTDNAEDPSDYVSYDPNTIHHLNRIPECALRFWHDKGRESMEYGHALLPHVLHRGPLDISSALRLHI